MIKVHVSSVSEVPKGKLLATIIPGRYGAYLVTTVNAEGDTHTDAAASPKRVTESSGAAFMVTVKDDDTVRLFATLG